MREEAYGKGAIKKPQLYEWPKHFGDGRASVNDDPLCWRLSNLTNDGNIQRGRHSGAVYTKIKCALIFHVYSNIRVSQVVFEIKFSMHRHGPSMAVFYFIY
jgi:hypothetical protein